MKTITAASFVELLQEDSSGVHAYDTRPNTQLGQGSLPGLKPLPLEAVQAGRLPDVNKDEAIYLICERGMMSELVGLYLEAAGFTEVYNVSGGLEALRRPDTLD